MITERQKVRRLKIALRDMEIARRTRHYLEAMRVLPNASTTEQTEWLDWVYVAISRKYKEHWTTEEWQYMDDYERFTKSGKY